MPKPPPDSRSSSVSRPRTSRPPPRPLRWLKSLFKRRLRLERRGLQIHVVLDPAPPEAPTTVAPANGQALRLSHAVLRKLLDSHADARRTLRHLVYVEEMLARSGSRALTKIPAPVLRKAQTQLELLARDAPAGSLEALEERLELALRGRSNDPGAHTRPQDLQVMEASHSLFDEEERRWTDRAPLDAVPTESRP